MTREQRVLAGDPKLGASQNIPNFPYAKYVELLGFKDIRMDSPDHASGAWAEALAADRPVLYEAVTDPKCRRYRRTSASSRPSRWPRRWSSATRTRRGVSNRRSRASFRSSPAAREGQITNSRSAGPLPSALVRALILPLIRHMRRRVDAPCNVARVGRPGRQVLAGSLFRNSLGLKRRT